ncbi:MAG: J domain-containing protein [Halobacteriota archaeon]
MPFEYLSVLPTWLLVGLGGGLGASAFVAGVFYYGNRKFPTPATDGSGRYDGENRRRREFREYLRAIGEPFEENVDVDGNVVAFYLLHRDVAITFDAQAYFRLETHPTYVVLCEHEMPGSHLGQRLPFEVPTIDAGPIPDPVGEAYDVLGVDRNADERTIKRAYRDRVKEVHPDQGGSRAEFKTVREAYTTALNHANPTAS